jgi:hypothetical protein
MYFIVSIDSCHGGKKHRLGIKTFFEWKFQVAGFCETATMITEVCMDSSSY